MTHGHLIVARTEPSDPLGEANMSNVAKLDALRNLFDPAVVAAWLDEVDSHRQHPRTAVQPRTVQPHPATRASEPLLTVKQLSERLGVTTNSIYEMVRTNSIPNVRLGTRIRFVWPRVEKWLDDSAKRQSTSSL
ncbi:MAG: hypothetical protein C0418_05705 [Coriobacteriaceae bacterium]|nr:hypothetical protein [Coriobacteriaceae bacterium]